MATTETDQKQIDTRPPISVKGVKSGLLFVVDEACAHVDLVEHLTKLLHGELASLFNGPETSIYVDYGTRVLTHKESNQILEMFLSKENFVLREFGSQTNARKSLFHNHRDQRENTRLNSLHRGTVRAGQQLTFDGDVVVIGDINPGGEVAATGDVYVLGRLRGMAHAGCEGDEQAIIAAAEFAPMQLRIADWISRAPETSLQTFMEFAYVREDGMAVDKLMYVQTIRGN